MAVVGFLVFASAFAASAAVFWLTLAPALPRIVSILRDGVDPQAASGAYLPPRDSLREPRLRVRAQIAPAPVRSIRRAAA